MSREAGEKQTKMRGTQKARQGILFQMMLLVLIPAIVLTLVVTIVSVNSMRSGMEEEALGGLQSLAEAVTVGFELKDPGDYALNAEGDLMKGELNFSKETKILESFTEGNDSDISVIFGKTRMATSLADQSVVGKDIDEDVWKTVQSGKVYTSSDVKIGGEHYYAAYLPLKNDDGSIIGSMFAGQPAKETNAYINKKITTVVVISVLVLILFAVFATFSIRKIAITIKESEKVISNVSGGNLGVSVDHKILQNKTELGLMAASLDDLTKRLRDIIGHLGDSAKQLFNSGENLDSMAAQCSETADGISSAVEDISQGAVSQAEDIETATKEMFEMGQYFGDIVKGIERLDSTSGRMYSAGAESMEIMEQLSESNDRTSNAIARISKQVHQTNVSAEEIREAINIITAISTETNLLSLNASIEAARAGEAGKGFAVVASQIQKLADESNESAQKIDDVVTNLLEESQMTVQVMAEVEETVAEQQKKMDATKAKFDQVTAGINEARQETENIKNCTNTCDKSREKMFDIIQNLSAISEENAASTEETTASMQELNATINLLAQSAKELKDLAAALEEEMSFFQL